MKQPEAPAGLGSVERWFALFDHLSDGVAISDESFRVLYLNPAARRILRLDDTPRPNRNICELVTASLHTPRLGRCQEICPLRDAPLKAGVTVQLDGVRVRCLSDPADRLHLTLIEDNTAEAELKRHQEDWRNMVAHDLRNPLTPILATLIMLLENPNLGEQDRKLVELSIGSARRMLELLSLFLDVAKLDAGLMAVKLGPVELAALAEPAAESQRALALQRGQALELAVPGGLTVRADEELLLRVVQNLVNNAVKYAGDGARITVGAEKTDRGARFWVRDNGPGIDARHLPRLFDRFYQAEARRAGATQGTGLGLAFARQALEAMGARIFVTSEKGVATEFSIVFPDC